MLDRFDTHDRGVSHRSQSNAENVMDVGIKNLKSGAGLSIGTTTTIVVDDRRSGHYPQEGDWDTRSEPGTAGAGRHTGQSWPREAG